MPRTTGPTPWRGRGFSARAAGRAVRRSCSGRPVGSSSSDLAMDRGRRDQAGREVTARVRHGPRPLQVRHRRQWQRHVRQPRYQLLGTPSDRGSHRPGYPPWPVITARGRVHAPPPVTKPRSCHEPRWAFTRVVPAESRRPQLITRRPGGGVCLHVPPPGHQPASLDSAAATGGSAALTHVAGSSRAHLGAAGHAQRRVSRLALLQLPQLGGTAHIHRRWPSLRR